ncbi:site-specific DNA-methyltransferase [Candidatus Bathyarchaeota archaeon]|nr:MAG: site-specific DNA-methyltransferase [Candidatus Bathyarchaeota archaeon]TMI53845.1 MAG: site-specific DNA-methyltransferase [Candidatus Bathyarchaeota archaeon]
MSPKSKRSKDAPSLQVFFGDLRKMTSREIADGEVSLIVTSPPYYNAPFDYPDLFPTYDDYLDLIKSFASQSKRVLGKGRICAIVTDDMLVKEGDGSRGRKYPLVADTTRIFLDEGFLYRDKITWVKPVGYTRISRRSGVVLQHPYPMYFYPDNIQESILLFQNGEFDYAHLKDAPKKILESSKIDTTKLNKERWNLTVWNITNVLPMAGRVEEGIAAFPDEIPRRLIKLFTMIGETVFDPFAGSGTTLKVAKELGREGIGYEIDLELKRVIRKKLAGENFVTEDRAGARRLRKSLQTKIHQQRSVAKSPVPRLIL